MKLVICDYCQEEFELPELECEKLEHNVHQYSFNCPHCDHKYISYYTNQRIRRDISRQQQCWKRYNKLKTEKASRKLLAQIRTQDRLIEKDMDALRKRMELA